MRALKDDNNIILPIKNKTVYFKTETFNTPILTDYTKDDFCVWSSGEMTNYSPSWKCFNSSDAYDFTNSWEGLTCPQYIAWSNKYDLYIPQITVRNSSSDHQTYWVKTGELQYWDGMSWVTEQSFTNNVSSNGEYWSIPIQNPVWSKQKRLYITTAGSSNVPIIADIKFNNAKIKMETDSSKYDVYENILVYKAFNL